MSIWNWYPLQHGLAIHPPLHAAILLCFWWSFGTCQLSVSCQSPAASFRMLRSHCQVLLVFMLWELEKGSICGDFSMHGKLSKLIQSSMSQGLRIPSFQLRSFFLRIAKVCGFLVMLADTALCTAVSLSEGQKRIPAFFPHGFMALLVVCSRKFLHGFVQNGSKWRHLAEMAERSCKAQKVRKQKHPGTQEMYLSQEYRKSTWALAIQLTQLHTL